MRRKHETDDLFSKRELSLLYLFLIIEKNLTVSTKMPRKYGISTLRYPKNFWGGRSLQQEKDIRGSKPKLQPNSYRYRSIVEWLLDSLEELSNALHSGYVTGSVRLPVKIKGHFDRLTKLVLE